MSKTKNKKAIQDAKKYKEIETAREKLLAKIKKQLEEIDDGPTLDEISKCFKR